MTKAQKEAKKIAAKIASEIKKTDETVKADETPTNETVKADETPTDETVKATDLQKSVVEKAMSEFLSTRNITINQTIDHVKAYDEAYEVVSANLPGYEGFLASNPVDDSESFELVKSWFKRLSFAEVMLSESMFNDSKTIADASYKKGNVRSKLNTYLKSLTFETFMSLTDEQGKALLAGQLFLTGPTRSGSSSEKVWKQPTTFRPEKNNGILFGLLNSGIDSKKELEIKWDARKTGTTAFSDQLAMMQRVYKNSGYGTLTIDGDKVTANVA